MIFTFMFVHRIYPKDLLLVCTASQADIIRRFEATESSSKYLIHLSPPSPISDSDVPHNRGISTETEQN